jgi:hypothetical protein
MRLPIAPIFAAVVGMAALAPIHAAAQSPAPPPQSCPFVGWIELFSSYVNKPAASFPTNDTSAANTADCVFHQWAWEAFAWATTGIQTSSGLVPRFLTLQTPDQLLPAPPTRTPKKPGLLRLSARSHVFSGAPGFTPGAGAIVEADGNMLVGQNGYPVYASVHMTQPYFATAQANLIVTGAYQKGDPNANFPLGSAVFKATWMRVGNGQNAPAGAYTMQAEVPVLQTIVTPGRVTIAPIPGRFTTVTVALVGLHVVGVTVNHPEFIWATFEHNLNSPATPDGTFAPSPTASSPNNYTFYKANTPYSQVNTAATPPTLALDAKTQTISPVTNVVLQNQTGGENQPNGAANIQGVNAASQPFMARQPSTTLSPTFANYFLVGTVWMPPNSYNLNSGQNNAVGSIFLANTTAETFLQTAGTSVPVNFTGLANCFGCHNPTSYSFQTPPPAQLANRLVALSHVLAIGSPYEVPNLIAGNLQRVPTPPAR